MPAESMRIYQIDGITCFDTDDFREARLLDAYGSDQFELGVEMAAEIIANWLEARMGEMVSVVTLTTTLEIAQQIRSGEWRGT